eukprot:scaffold4872_cov178-Skeletonema_menzelii.AAC.1
MVAMRVAAIYHGPYGSSKHLGQLLRNRTYVAYNLVCSDSAARFCSPLAKIIRTQKICSDSPLSFGRGPRDHT